MKQFLKDVGKGLAFSIVMGLLVGCISKPVTDEMVSKNIHYFQDKRTHICFAYHDNGMGGSITAVPCENVAQLLENPWSR